MRTGAIGSTPIKLKNNRHCQWQCFSSLVKAGAWFVTIYGPVFATQPLRCKALSCYLISRNSRAPRRPILMWKTLKQGEKVSLGDTLRYQSTSNNLLQKDEQYLVVRIDQHYFEIIHKSSDENTIEPPRRKVVRYLDIGYNVLVERWFEPQES